ncbi:MAG TPA: arsenate reductase (azurin) large subunit [Chloroflexus aurantiacus]|uniref:Arsenite oxidase, large subunit n=1 Tax=Chloroflexus aurantiacus (strain ATCC 29366 / DSM 635 / J-10-fl) TaxID=324602 RepID=A9WJY7_CHLAA|nr:arsenate reductase (azurin) large subunit [Chloroflexus aurantiacus]ABY34438.1 arsenite oxidase, large subunit [Chloroflexus aurantiacus J-10-fl]RMG46162.1 MAG: arsenate reductase (azurin) large subunit [Chloroflexota bacterium]GIV94075.1 MAG: arsenite oxidase large subunit [Chloroflexus sp.]HBW68072.1 arsenate reductase (azurin) large subunit [Chloroflexus aurantiacus]
MPVYRPADRMVLPPVDAEKYQTVCHYCIVGCGYHVYKWPEGRSGGLLPDQNALGVDFTKQVAPLSGDWIAPDHHTVITERDGRRFHIAIVPDKECVVNKGHHSGRGGTLGSSLYRPDGPTHVRLTHPLVYRATEQSPTTWDDAIDLAARVIYGSILRDGNNSIFMKIFDHGGGGGGFENNWAVGKFFFNAVQTINCSIHNRPAYNSEVHASRDMGVPELNFAYVDAELSDTIVLWGANSYETQTNFYLVHMLPNLQGTTVKAKQDARPGEQVGPGRIIVIDPRRTATVVVSERAAGKDRVLHLQLNPGTDIALANAIARVVYERGWHDKDFVANRVEAETVQPFLEQSLQIGKSLDEVLAEAEQITGLSRAQIEQAASWIAETKSDGSRPRSIFLYEKGVIWGMKNYQNIGSIVNLALLTGNFGKPGTGCGRLGGHQEGYVRPGYPGPRPAPYIDDLLSQGQGNVFYVVGCNPAVTTLNAQRMRETLQTRGKLVRDAIDASFGADNATKAQAILDAISQGGLFIIVQDIYPIETARYAHVVFPAAAWGESPITSINGERRLRLYEKFMDPPGIAEPDWKIFGMLAQRIKALAQADGNADIAQRFSGFEWQTAEEVFLEGGQSFADGVKASTERYKGVDYAFLKAAGNNGIQTPVTIVNGQPQGRVRYFENGEPFYTESGKAKMLPTPWPGFPAIVQEQINKYPYFLTNGRNNNWQTFYNDLNIPFHAERVPLSYIEINPQDAQREGIQPGDIVQLYNDYGETTAYAVVSNSVKPGLIFMLFAHPRSTANSLTTPYVDPEVIIPYYKGSAVGLRRLGRLADFDARLTYQPTNFEPVV